MEYEIILTTDSKPDYSVFYLTIGDQRYRVEGMITCPDCEGTGYRKGEIDPVTGGTKQCTSCRTSGQVYNCIPIE